MKPTTPLRCLVLAGLAALLSGCPQNGTGGDAGCDGEVGCACAAGNVCSAGECVAGTCTDCRRGAEACACRSNGTCNTGLACTGGVCGACAAGTQGCPCGANDSCDPGLACTTGTCTPTGCTVGAPSCPCRTTAPVCDGNAYCDGNTVCQACSADMPGCPCGAGNTCAGGLVCDTTLTKCRAAATCLDLLDGGLCKTHQACTEAAGSDAVCLADTCVADWKWDARTSTCVGCVSPGCASEPTCSQGDAGIGDDCNAQHRDCVANGTVPYCGSCSPGYTQNAALVCVASVMCGSATCGTTEYCDANNGSPICRSWPCPIGEAQDTGGTCRSCQGRTCNAPGESGRLWPFMNIGGQCICETLPGWFQPGGGAGFPLLCDEDGDGWVNEDAASLVDPQVLANARCTIETATTVQLQDELGTPLTLTSCDVEGLVADAGGCTLLPLRLLETQRNDRPSSLASEQVHAPVYGQNGGADSGVAGGAGRFLEAKELNSLTKACVQEIGDFNDNGIGDVTEVNPTGTIARDKDRNRLEQLGYFIELYTSYFVPGTPYGTLVIKELPRCSPDFPLHYTPGSAEAYDGGASTYWRTCSRNRDPGFSATAPNFDFGQFDCADPTGSCAYVPPPHPALAAPVDPKVNLFRNFGTCETLAVGTGAPLDNRWRGMTHHSQFKCVSVKTNPAANGYDVDAGSVSAAGDMVMNQCAARPCTAGAACRSTPGSGRQSDRPAIDCQATVPAGSGRFGFAAVRYRGYGNSANGYPFSAYRGGCVNEELEMPALPPMLPTYDTYVCPYPEYLNVFHSFDGGMKARSDNAYGRYSCFGDLPNFLWGPAPGGGAERATLLWAPDAGGSTFGVWR